MINITKKTKIILFAGLLVALVLPFSNLGMVDATSDVDKIKKDSKETKDNHKDEKKDDKSKEYNYEKKSNFVEKDHHNYEADKVLEKMLPLLQVMPDSSIGNEPTSNEASLDRKEIDKLQKQLDKVTKEHKDKIIDKELRKELKAARQLIKDSGIPTHLLATGIDHLYIQLSKENAKYEEQIIKIMNNLPYKIEYGDGVKRSACVTTSDDCNYEVGGIKIQIKSSIISAASCSLSMPMEKDGVPGFLTAAHCFNGHSENVYQPDDSQESHIIGFSNSTWRSFEDDGECDCAWIKDTSSTQQKAGVYALPNSYWATYTTEVPSISDGAMLRGFENNNGQYNWAHLIDYDDIEISDWWGFGKTTVNMMSFVSPIQGGDSGGSVFYGSAYIGLVVGSGMIDDELHVIFVPWNHITENISGLELNPHP